MRIDRGEFVGVIGANGAGKTSLLMALSGAVRAKGGNVTLDGQDVTHLPQHLRVSNGIAIVPEGRQVFGPLTVMENLELGGFHRRGASRAEIVRDQEMMLDLFPILRRRARQLAATLSGGEQQMLAIARALMARPRLLLLDEPAFGLAPTILPGIFWILRGINGRPRGWRSRWSIACTCSSPGGSPPAARHSRSPPSKARWMRSGSTRVRSAA